MTPRRLVHALRGALLGAMAPVLASPLTAPAALAAPAAAVPPSSAAASAERFGLDGISAGIDFVTVMPGERLPLRAVDAHGRPLDVQWKSAAGKVAYGDHLAVFEAPLQAGPVTLLGESFDGDRARARRLTVIVTVPAAQVRNGKLNGYPIGSYPRGFGAGGSQVANRGSRRAYDVPAGFVELNAATVQTPLSRHYRLGDFAGKDAWVNGRKYIFVEPKLVEKLERAIDTLNASGVRTGKLQLMSAYRSPYLNAAIGNETTLSRHTYGDAADVLAADFDGNGRIDRADGELLFWAFDKLDRETSLTGGGSLYAPTSAHGYFVHTDTRGHLARW